ncbi:VOC family protein [Streptomyces sp. NPDC057616]|uniref:VOC family protein n=1 Tax=Streptomyces sp. NPDC057616 TaxID=3346183 RepID=UPI0036CAC274
MTSHDHSTPPAVAVDFDHTSFAVRDAMSWARRLRRELGATPVIGETLEEFRYLLFYVGTQRDGSRVELLEPNGPGFLSRFLDRHGEGAHHVTFTVPDLREAVRQARSIGATVVGEDYEHPAWREAFLLPDARLRVVVQLAQTDRSYPPTEELLTSRERDVTSLPSTGSATDSDWWTPVWSTPAGPAVVLGPTHLSTTDPEFSRNLFASVLEADVTGHDDELLFTWPSGALRVRTAEHAGITGVGLEDTSVEGLTIGSVPLGHPADFG